MHVKSILQAAVISVSAILLFSGFFLGANNFVFATANSYVESDAEVSEPPVLAGEFSQPITPPEITIKLHDVPTVSEFAKLAISETDAAFAGAQYIWEVFGETIDGSIVELLLTEYYDRAIMHWLGVVLLNGEITFSFIIDAFSGMGLTVSNFANMQQHFLTVDEFANRDLSLPQVTHQHEQTVTDAAHKFFRQTEIVSVTLESVSFGNTTQVFQDGTNMVTGVNTSGRILTFIATDIFGRSVSVLLNCDSNDLIGVRRLL
ncbi:MAG: hypothetical protein FWB96_09535 [Defluviitaleaceae bacterium]|nr:hypothetical protein [Defluviitaleaceae bacterium]MCL2263058.1 hypothetical protein [Defluviitaleaceae bacterium]